MNSNRKILWVTDPWETLDHPKDTSLRLIEESLKLGIPTFWCDFKSIHLENQKISLAAQKVLSVGNGRLEETIRLSEPKEYIPSHFSVIHYRTDPPVDSHYLHPLQLLASAVEKTRTRIYNPPEALFRLSEKSGAGLPKAWVPQTLMTSDRERLLRFGRRLGVTVAKPPNQAQSKGVEKLDWTTPDGEAKALQMVEKMTLGFSTPIVLQEFLKAVYGGERRLWFAAGKLVGHAIKRPLPGDFRVQIDQGSSLSTGELSTREVKRAKEIGVYLKKQKITLAAVDLIDCRISDLNLTSPGLIVQMEAITGQNLARAILKECI